MFAQIRRGDRDALGVLMKAHKNLAWSAANEYRGFGMPAEDIAQEAMRGILIAADRFSPERGPRFCSYAWFYAKKYALRAVENQALLIRLPSRVWRERRIGELRSRFSPYPANLSRDAADGINGHRADDTQARIESALEQLAPRQREVLMHAFRFPGAELCPAPRRSEITAAVRRLRAVFSSTPNIRKDSIYGHID